jgi:hypothetical protein
MFKKARKRIRRGRIRNQAITVAIALKQIMDKQENVVPLPVNEYTLHLRARTKSCDGYLH